MNNIDAVYIHIPFCKTICSYCDFCKIIYNKKYIANYLKALNQEIKTFYKNDVIKTLYIGGGTPSSLEIDDIKRLMKILKQFKVSKNLEFTVELNVEHINKELLSLLYQNGVNRLSIGVQTFNENHLKLLKRNHQQEDVLKAINLAKEIGFNNLSIDLIYALPNQTKEELISDLNIFLKLDINHLSIYSLIIEPQTLLYINKTNYLDEELDYEMYKLINDFLTKKGYLHYELSNYCKLGFEGKHNLGYWNNLEYYGFGMGASGYVDNIRYTNTLNINKYINNHFHDKEELIDIKTKLENEFMLGLRKIKGINKQLFLKKYGFQIDEILEIKKLIKEGKLIDDKINIYISPEYLYLSNDILIDLMV